jgi:hypothetical protein
MENLIDSIEMRDVRSTQERRRHSRNDCFIEAYCMVQGRGYKGSIQNISEGGAYLSIRGEKFLPGEEIFLVARDGLQADQLMSKIVWVGSKGIGVDFQISEINCGEAEAEQEDARTTEDEDKKMGRLRQRRVCWEPSTGTVVGYRLYWSLDGPVDYDSDHADVGKVTQILLPEGIPSFPSFAGEIELGISAFSQAGNESEITKMTVHLDFTVPGAPRNLRIEEQ